MSSPSKWLFATSLFTISSLTFSQTEDVEQLREEVNSLKQQYEQRLQALEDSDTNNESNKSNFNPDLSVILDGRISSYKHHYIC